ncbi:MAG: putative multicopper oxidase [Gemmatimonadetes bacterium]|nr:putative multicopper oxidase [Gemmatimonadota bacterium]
MRATDLTSRILTRYRAEFRGLVRRVAPFVGGTVAVLAPPAHAQAASDTLSEPSVVTSHAGVLRFSLDPAISTVTVAGGRVALMAYDGQYVPPTLRVHPGDTIRLRLSNALDEPTNLHVHGLAVSPLGNSDNPFLHIAPGESEDYEIRVPADHPPGLFWYHPHPHHFSDVQIRHGMSGALIVEGLLDSFPTLRHVRERVMLLKDLQLENGRVAIKSIGKNDTRTINGLANPLIVLRPGETELWRIANVGADVYYELSLEGHRFDVLARDGHRLTHLEPTDTLELSPGARVEALVTAGAAGVHLLHDGDVDTGPAGNQYDGTVMATVRVEGPPATPITLPAALLPVEDLRARVTNRRTIVYSESKDGDTFFIDGKTFDMNRIDVRVKLGAVEEWTIRNDADELHSFHIHQAPFQVTEIDGVPQPADGYRDIVDVPIGGQVKVVIPFTNPIIVGRFVYHCHIISHEDKGMMATIEVTP